MVIIRYRFGIVGCVTVTGRKRRDLFLQPSKQIRPALTHSGRVEATPASSECERPITGLSGQP